MFESEFDIWTSPPPSFKDGKLLFVAEKNDFDNSTDKINTRYSICVIDFTIKTLKYFDDIDPIVNHFYFTRNSLNIVGNKAYFEYDYCTVPITDVYSVETDEYVEGYEEFLNYNS